MSKSPVNQVSSYSNLATAEYLPMYLRPTSYYLVCHYNSRVVLTYLRKQRVLYYTFRNTKS